MSEKEYTASVRVSKETLEMLQPHIDSGQLEAMIQERLMKKFHEFIEKEQANAVSGGSE